MVESDGGGSVTLLEEVQATGIGELKHAMLHGASPLFLRGFMDLYDDHRILMRGIVAKASEEFCNEHEMVRRDGDPARALSWLFQKNTAA